VANHVPGDGYRDANGYHYVSTFVGMVPAENPRLSVIVIMDEPDQAKSYYAADVAAPLFQQLGALALRALRIPPAAPGDNPFTDVPAVGSWLAATAQAEKAVGPGAAATTSTSTTVPRTTTTTRGR